MNTHAVAEKLQSLGRRGDTVLAHINPQEARLLRARGGSGSRNPKTGLLEFWEGDPSVAGGGTVAGSDFGGNAAPGESTTGFTGSYTNGADINGLDFGPPQTAMSFDEMGLDMSNLGIPDAAGREGVGNMAGLAGPATGGVEGFLINLAKAKVLGLLASTPGLPIAGIVAAGKAGMAGYNAPPGQGLNATLGSLSDTFANFGLNQATGGAWGAMQGNMGMFGPATGPAPAGNTSSGDQGGVSASGYSPMIDYLRGGYGLYQANKLAQLAKGTAAEQTAGNQLNQLIGDPSSITKMPGYEAGLQAVQRAAAGKGYLASGNLTIALSKFGTDFYNNSLSTLNTLANTNAGIRQQNRNNSISLAGQALNSLGYGYTRSNRPGGGGGTPSYAYTDTGMSSQADTYSEAPPADLGDFYG